MVIDVDSSWLWEVLSLRVMNLVDGEVEDKVQDAWQNISKTFGGVADCSAFVDLGGNVSFSVARQSDPTSPVVRPVGGISKMALMRCFDRRAPSGNPCRARRTHAARLSRCRAPPRTGQRPVESRRSQSVGESPRCAEKARDSALALP